LDRLFLAGGLTILVCNQPPSSTQPGRPSVSRCNEYQQKLGCTQSAIFVVLQYKLVFGWGLRKWR